jgi:hypothetical protein
MHVECCGCKDILGHTTCAITIILASICWGASRNMGAIKGPKSSFQEWEELWIVSNVRFNGFVGYRKLDVCVVKSRGSDSIKNGMEASEGGSIYN